MLDEALFAITSPSPVTVVLAHATACDPSLHHISMRLVIIDPGVRIAFNLAWIAILPDSSLFRSPMVQVSIVPGSGAGLAHMNSRLSL